MMRAMRGLVGTVVFVAGGSLLVGCASKKETVAPAPVAPAPVVAQTPVSEPEPPPRVDSEGNPVDATGRPLGRTFYFEFDQARLAERDLRMLALHAGYLRDFRNRRITIEGHCDERGTREYNLALGERRADAVARYLTSAGVRASQIETVSYGEERPEDAGHDESAWSRNRRAVMIYQ